MRARLLIKCRKWKSLFTKSRVACGLLIGTVLLAQSCRIPGDSQKYNLRLGKATGEGTQLTPGAADLAFLIHSPIFHNDLKSLLKNQNSDRLLSDFSEAITGHPEPVELHGLSSSTRTIALGVGCLLIATAPTLMGRSNPYWTKRPELDFRCGLDSLPCLGLEPRDTSVADLPHVLTPV